MRSTLNVNMIHRRLTRLFSDQDYGVSLRKRVLDWSSYITVEMWDYAELGGATPRKPDSRITGLLDYRKYLPTPRETDSPKWLTAINQHFVQLLISQK